MTASKSDRWVARLVRALFLPLLLAAASPVLSHDLWLQPESDAADSKSVSLRAVVGANFPKGEETKKAAEYREARWQRGGKIESLPDFAAEPTLQGRVTGDEGFYAAVLGPTKEIDLKVSEAREYLEGEAGLDEKALASLLRGAGPTIHETYTRSLKVLHLPKGSPDAPKDMPLGLPLEIELLHLDRAQDGRRALEFRLLKEGKAVPGAFFRVIDRDGKTRRITADGEGRARADAPPSGALLIAHIALAGSSPGRYETQWTNLAIYERP